MAFVGGLMIGMCFGAAWGVLIMAVVTISKREDIRRGYLREPNRH